MSAAREKALTIFARRPRYDLREAGRYPKSFCSPEPIPYAAFIADHHFGVDPAALWIEGESPFQAEWFHPCLSESQFEEWRATILGRKVDEVSNDATNKRGPRPTTLERVIKEMMRDTDGELSPEILKGMKEKTLATKYDVSRDTARKARRAVLSNFVRNSILDK